MSTEKLALQPMAADVLSMIEPSLCGALRVPEPDCRPGVAPDFRHLAIPEPDATRRPDTAAHPSTFRELAYGLIRVLDGDGVAGGHWNPTLDTAVKIAALKQLLLTRAFDQRMYRAQRAGKTSFYMKSSGEEAVSIGAALALGRDDMCFPTYRQQGLLIGRNYPLADMMCQRWLGFFRQVGK